MEGLLIGLLRGAGLLERERLPDEGERCDVDLADEDGCEKDRLEEALVLLEREVLIDGADELADDLTDGVPVGAGMALMTIFLEVAPGLMGSTLFLSGLAPALLLTTVALLRE